ncbi:MAG: ABC transporter permease [Lactovum sp.]
MNKQLLLVAKNTYFKYIKSFSFWSMILSPFLIVVLYLGMIFFISSGYSASSDVAIVGRPNLTKIFKESKDIEDDLSDIATVKEAKKALKSEEIDAYLTEESGKYVLTSSSKASSRINASDYSNALLELEMINKANALGISSEELGKLLSPVDFSMLILSEDESQDGGENRDMANNIIATVVTLLIFVLLMFYTSIVAREIANEKSNRIMEILLAATSTNIQYYGKILGIICLVISQILFYIIAFFIIYPLIKMNDTASSMISDLLEMMIGVDFTFIIYACLMSFFGILGYIFLASIISSLVNDLSQAQQAIQPITYLSMVGYIGGIAGAAAPDNLILQISSFIPFISPTLMTGRYAIEYVTSIEAYLALLLQIIGTVLVAKFGEKIYAKNVLSYSDESIFKQFVRNLREK